jgi:hypothetical protein
MGILNHLSRRHNRARVREPLPARRDADGLAEIILLIVDAER